jgi:hypothetical protein
VELFSGKKKKIGMNGFVFLNLKSWINIVNGREASSLENDRSPLRRSHGRHAAAKNKSTKANKKRVCSVLLSYCYLKIINLFCFKLNFLYF